MLFEVYDDLGLVRRFRRLTEARAFAKRIQGRVVKKNFVPEGPPALF